MDAIKKTVKASDTAREMIVRMQTPNVIMRETITSEAIGVKIPFTIRSSKNNAPMIKTKNPIRIIFTHFDNFFSPKFLLLII